jgi:hypothetical protein
MKAPLMSIHIKITSGKIVINSKRVQFKHAENVKFTLRIVKREKF